MKEIKVYVRPDMAERIVDALDDAGISGMTIINVEAIGTECDPEHFKYSVEYVRKYSTVVKLEIVCSDEEAPAFVEIIRKKGHTGFKGDGMIFVSDVAEAVSIRTGRTGDVALRNPESEG